MQINKTELIKGVIETLEWVLKDIDYKNQVDAQDTDAAMGEHIMPNDSPEVAKARQQLRALIHWRDHPPEMQFQYTIPPTNCNQCGKEAGPFCPYQPLDGVKRPPPNPCPQFEMKVRTQCPLCRSFQDLSTMREHEYKCREFGDITNDQPESCSKFTPR